MTSTRSCAQPRARARRRELRRAASISASSALRASLAALPTAARCSGGSSATPRSSCGSSALRPRKAIRTSSSAARVGGGRDRGLRPAAADLVDPVECSCACGHPTSARTARRSPPSRRSASRSAIGMRATSSAARAPRRAARRARRRPAASTSRVWRSRAQRRRIARVRRAARRDERDRRARAGCRRSAARASGTAKIAPIDARTAFGPNGSAVPGPSATHEAPNASRERSTVPTLPGVADAVQVDAQRADGARPPSAARRRRARACPSRAPRPPASSSGSTSMPGRPLPAAAKRSTAAPSRRRRPPPADPRPRRRSGPPLALAPARRSLRISLSFSLWRLVIKVIGHRNKKGALRSERRPWRYWCRLCSAGSQRLAGALGKSSEGVGVADGDVRQDLAVQLDPASCRPCMNCE